jgi:2-polyprenyl-6-methoxyphenol hydroxylase-like FAD-dependent oxidoreductase
MSIKNVVILGAGPCGLSTAIALSKMSALTPGLSPLRITIIETRPKLQTIGGTINMTPLAMRYLDHLGAGQQLKENSIELITGVDAISLRLGWRLGNRWGGVGARRTARYELVRSLYDAIEREHGNSVRVEWGKRVSEISEVNDQVQLKFEDHSTHECDILLGCDGINSAARSLWVEPTRKKEYSGRGVAMGWAEGVANQIKDSGSSPITFPNGDHALRDTAAFGATGGTLITSFYEPTRQDIFFAHVREMTEHDAVGRDGWHLVGEEQEVVRREVVDTYTKGRVNGIQDVIDKCDRWQIYPIYQLLPQGRWHKGRVLLLGDAAHAVSIPTIGTSRHLLVRQSLIYLFADAAPGRKHRHRNRRWRPHRTNPQSKCIAVCRAAFLRF